MISNSSKNGIKLSKSYESSLSHIIIYLPLALLIPFIKALPLPFLDTLINLAWVPLIISILESLLPLSVINTSPFILLFLRKLKALFIQVPIVFSSFKHGLIL